MTPTLAVVMVLMGIAIGIAIGWIAWRRPPRDAVYSYQSETPTLKVRADNLTDEELQRFIAKWEESFNQPSGGPAFQRLLDDVAAKVEAAGLAPEDWMRVPEDQAVVGDTIVRADGTTEVITSRYVHTHELADAHVIRRREHRRG